MKFLLAVSGGPDSMAMLAMYRKKTQAVCIVNYKKRENSDLDVEKVTDYCNLYNIKYYIHNVTSKKYENNQKVNFQTLARQIRYDFFQEVAEKEQNCHLMIAHNMNDHLETAYMQQKRDSKALFYGIENKSEYFGLKITRPVLRFKKTTLQRYCDEKKIPYAIDYTNELDIYERNRVRKIINAWDSVRTFEFLKSIRKYNKKNKHLRKKINIFFKKWKISAFDLNLLKTFEAKIQYYLIYEFLKFNNQVNNNRHKINSIIVFLNKGNKTKNFRLENQNKLLINNNKLLIC